MKKARQLMPHLKVDQEDNLANGDPCRIVKIVCTICCRKKIASSIHFEKPFGPMYYLESRLLRRGLSWPIVSRHGSLCVFCFAEARMMSRSVRSNAYHGHISCCILAICTPKPPVTGLAAGGLMIEMARVVRNCNSALESKHVRSKARTRHQRYRSLSIYRGCDSTFVCDPFSCCCCCCIPRSCCCCCCWCGVGFFQEGLKWN